MRYKDFARVMWSDDVHHQLQTPEPEFTIGAKSEMRPLRHLFLPLKSAGFYNDNIQPRATIFGVCCPCSPSQSEMGVQPLKRFPRRVLTGLARALNLVTKPVAGQERLQQRAVRHVLKRSEGPVKHSQPG